MIRAQRTVPQSSMPITAALREAVLMTGALSQSMTRPNFFCFFSQAAGAVYAVRCAATAAGPSGDASKAVRVTLSGIFKAVRTSSLWRLLR